MAETVAQVEAPLTKLRPLFLALASSAALAFNAAARDISEARTGADGVEWLYHERADAIDDLPIVAVAGTLTIDGTSSPYGPSIVLLCAAGQERSIRILGPAWLLGDGRRWPLTVRIDRGEPFQVEAAGQRGALGTALVPYRQGGEAVMQGLLNARERIAVRDQEGRTIVFPMGDRPQVTRAMARCAELERAATH